ncbi:MAG: hypothetical protein WBL53_07265 [Pseudonocardiaceae bacterium]
MIRHRTVAALLAMMLATTVVGGLLNSPPVSAAAADPAASDSAVTVSGQGDFPNLKVTVSQTKNLINQTVKVSWTGGAPTVDLASFGINYLQIMQCWGDDPAGPDRTQCQFGASNAAVSGWASLRQVDAGPVDPNETLKPAAFGGTYVPFWAVGKDKPTGAATLNSNDFFDSQVTNEIPFARTHGDGSGEEFFEVETVRQAAGLGCGDKVIIGGVTQSQSRSCWLVIVPRSNKEVDGSTRTGQNGNNSYLQSSPLSQSNWDQRIIVPLEFQPVGQACPIGSPERPVVGHELVVDAVSSWQPALCAGGGTLFSYAQLPDDVARNQVQDGRLALVNNPIPPDQVPADHPLVYAPVGLSGLTFAFNIDHQPDRNAPPEILKLNGQRFTSMKLTPRLVAKLLTQSYERSVVPGDASVQNNPNGLLVDPEFLDLNPDYKSFVDFSVPVPDALVQLNGADVTSQLWSWVIADPDARAFLTGTPDPWGMVVNPGNQHLSLPTSIFPRNDQSCSDTVTPDPQNIDNNLTLTTCNLDLHPFAKDMHDAGRSASRGDTQGKIASIDAGDNIVPKSLPRQGAGQQALIAVVDVATAIRYGLPTAQLRNAAGTFVAPTPESLLAGEAAMKPSAVAGVLGVDLGSSDPKAYPLTALSYAVAATSKMDAATGKDYAAFLRYAGGPGQQQGLGPGLLPPGMVPLPASLKAQTIAAAATIEAQTAKTAPVPPAPAISAPTNAPTQNSTDGPNTAAGTNGTATNSGGGRPAATPPGVTAPGAGPPANVPTVIQTPVAVRRTPSLPAPAVGALLLVILIAGGLAATSAPVTRLLGGVLRRRLRKEVTPTEQ